MEEFRKCLNCGYERGFHSSFKKEEKGFRVIFICPECGSSFDIGLIETRIDELNPEKGKTY
jgi:predicted RNA-binding Zn-ribbon protein involved in translation (DUF1610 family)